MRKFLIISLVTCACFLRAQVWTNLIDSVPFGNQPDIWDVAVDTNSNILYLGGRFSRINQHTTHGVIRYNGTTFDTLQCGTDANFPGATNWSTVKQLVMYKNKLYVFGTFDRAGYYYSPYMACWNGTSWDSIRTTGIPEFAFMQNGDMFVDGVDAIQGVACGGVARFDGVNWYDYPIPHTAGHTVFNMTYFQGKLYKSGGVTASSSYANLSYSDGINWIPWVGAAGDGNKEIYGMKVIDTLMFVYGRFDNIAGTNCKGLAAYNGKQWYGFGQGLSTSGWETIHNIQKINGELYITGIFDKVEGVGNSNYPQSTNLAKFDGQKWCLISPPFDNDALGLVKYNNQIYVYGGFNKIGNDTVRGIGKFNGGYTNAICSQTVTITVSTLGINDIVELGNLKIYPNPTKDLLNIEIANFETVNVKLDLISSLGEVIQSIENINSKNEMNLSSLSPGIYYLRIKNNEGYQMTKIIKE